MNKEEIKINISKDNQEMSLDLSKEEALKIINGNQDSQECLFELIKHAITITLGEEPEIIKNPKK